MLLKYLIWTPTQKTHFNSGFPSTFAARTASAVSVASFASSLFIVSANAGGTVVWLVFKPIVEVVWQNVRGSWNSKVQYRCHGGRDGAVAYATPLAERQTENWIKYVSNSVKAAGLNKIKKGFMFIAIFRNKKSSVRRNALLDDLCSRFLSLIFVAQEKWRERDSGRGKGFAKTWGSAKWWISNVTMIFNEFRTLYES